VFVKLTRKNTTRGARLYPIRPSKIEFLQRAGEMKAIFAGRMGTGAN